MTERKALTPVQRKKRIIRQTACVRRGVQALFFLTMPGAFAAGFSGVKSICSALGSTQPLSWNAFTMALAGLCAFTLLFGRFFCGYACAFGTFGDLIYWLSGLVQKKLLRRKKQVTLPQKLLAPAQKVKFVLLAAIVILSVAGIYPRLSGYSPWTVFSLLTSLRFPAAENRGGVLIFLLIVAGMAVQERFFCQFLCPMGAVFALQPILPQGQLQRQPEQCLRGCNACRNNCPVDLKLEGNGLRNGECIGCQRCAGLCPKGNLRRWDARLIPFEPAAVLLRGVLLFVLGALIGLVRLG